ncbi:MAG: tetratricopeptide repeat protein [Caldithrix sp.]|nr:MAG: tetratricopeptide repeat protein [Caldithrix sp.]
MPPNLRAKYVRGHALYRKGNYQEARNIWEQILKEQPYNKTVLDAIDSARERLNKQQRH